jgi:DNA repair protein RecO (recombination protein O)
MEYKLQGIVIGKKAINDWDLLVSLYTREKGKIKCVSKKAKKSSETMAKLEIFNENDFLLSERNGLDVIYQIDLLKQNLTLRTDFKRYTLANDFVIIINSITPLEHKNNLLYELLEKSLQMLNDGQKKRIVREYFQNTLLKIEGILAKDKKVTDMEFREIIKEYSGVK